jgi:hypothetical protein
MIVPGTIDCANLIPVKNRKDGYSKEKTQIIKAGITIVCGIIEHETENKMVGTKSFQSVCPRNGLTTPLQC